MRRVSVIGSPASGKTTTARRVADSLGVPHLELDSVFHQPDWTQLPSEDFRSRVTEFTDQRQWVVDGNYTSHGAADIVWPKADTIVWLDPPKRVVMSRVIRRTLKRAITREELWNGNREPLANFYSTNPEENIVLWAWTRFDVYRERYGEAMSNGAWDHACVCRLRSSSEVEEFLASLG